MSSFDQQVCLPNWRYFKVDPENSFSLHISDDVVFLPCRSLKQTSYIAKPAASWLNNFLVWGISRSIWVLVVRSGAHIIRYWFICQIAIVIFVYSGFMLGIRHRICLRWLKKKKKGSPVLSSRVCNIWLWYCI